MKCPRCEKYFNCEVCGQVGLEYKFCPYCGIKLKEDAEHTTDTWIDGYYVGSGI